MQADQDQINRMLGAVDTTHAQVIQVRLEIFWLVCLFSHMLQLRIPDWVMILV